MEKTKSDLAIEAIEARMEPITAAHRVAQCLDTIARLLPSLSAEAKRCLDHSKPITPSGNGLTFLAECLRAASPIEPVTDGERQTIWENTVDCANDLSSRDRAEMMVESWTEADWRYEADMLKAYALDDGD